MEKQVKVQYVLYEFKGSQPSLKVKFYDENNELKEWNITVFTGGSKLPNENWFELVKAGHELPKLDALSYEIQGL